MKKVICITGASHGLGRELVAALSPGNQVIALDLESDVLPAVAAKFNCDHFFCDVTNHILVNDTIDKIEKKYGGIDCLINSAGAYVDGDLSTNNPEAIRKVVEVNILGPINMCRYTVPLMLKNKSGTIININSHAGLYARDHFSVYHGSKWALTGFTESLRLELEPHGVKVTDVFPGLMDTSFTKDSQIKRDFTKALDPHEVVKVIQFILSLDKHTTLPQIGVRYI